MRRSDGLEPGASLQDAAAGLLALTLIVAPLLVLPSLKDAFYLPKLTLVAVAVTIAGALLLIAAYLRGGRGRGRSRRPGVFGGNRISGASRALHMRAMDALVATLLLLAAVSTVFAEAPMYSMLGKYGRPEGLLSLFVYAGVYLIASRLAWNRMRVLMLLAGLAAGAALASVYAIAEVQGISFIDWGEVPFDRTRIAGTLGNPTLLAHYLAIALSILPAGVLLSRREWTRILWSLPLTASWTALLLTRGRAGIAAAALGTALFVTVALAHRFRARREAALPAASGSSRPGFAPAFASASGWSAAIVVLAVALSLALASGPLSSLGGRASPPAPSSTGADADASTEDTPSADTSAQDRRYIWAGALELIGDRPLLGYGPDSFQLVFTRAQSLASARIEQTGVNVGRSAEDAHDAPLQWGATLGLSGLTVMLALFVAPLVMTFSSASMAPPASASASWALPPLAAFLAAAALTPVVTLPYVLLFGVLGMVTALTGSGAGTVKPGTPKPGRPVSTSVRGNPMTIALGLPALVALTVLLTVPLIADARFSQAERDQIAGSTDSAAIGYEQATLLNPLRDKYIGVWGQRVAQRGSAQGDPTLIRAGVDLLVRASERNPAEPSYHLVAALGAISLQDQDPTWLDAGIDRLDRAARLAPWDVRINHWLGRALLDRYMRDRTERDLERAEIHLTRALRVLPEYSPSRAALEELNQLKAGR